MKKLVALSGLLLLSSCVSYTSKMKDILETAYKGSPEEAVAKLDKTNIATSSEDQVVYRMERGSLLFMSRQFQEAAQEWGLAQKRLEELYTVSVSRQAGSLLSNDTVLDYEGEAHEKALLPVYASMSYALQGKFDSAMVEARRTSRILEEIAKEGEAKYKRDAFPHFLSGVFYEMRGEWDSALIEYQRAYDSYQSNATWIPDSSADAIASSLGRLAEFRGRNQVVSQLKNKNYQWDSQNDFIKKAEVIIFFENGISPLKVSERFDIPVSISGGVQTASIAFPVYVEQSYAKQQADILVNGQKQGRTSVLQNIEVIAKQSLDDRRLKDGVRMAMRVLTKSAASAGLTKATGDKTLGFLSSLAFSATEIADTRSWTFLPAQIQVARLTIPAGEEVSIRISPDASGKPYEEVVKLAQGQKHFMHYRSL